RHGTGLPEPGFARGAACGTPPHEVSRLLRSAGGLRNDRGRLERRSRPGAIVHVVRLCDVSVRMTHFRVNATASRRRADTGNFGRVVGDDQLLDQGRFTATYKYAVLLALLDL